MSKGGTHPASVSEMHSSKPPGPTLLPAAHPGTLFPDPRPPLLTPGLFVPMVLILPLLQRTSGGETPRQAEHRPPGFKS